MFLTILSCYNIGVKKHRFWNGAAWVHFQLHKLCKLEQVVWFSLCLSLLTWKIGIDNSTHLSYTVVLKI